MAKLPKPFLILFLSFCNGLTLDEINCVILRRTCLDGRSKNLDRTLVRFICPS